MSLKIHVFILVNNANHYIIPRYNKIHLGFHCCVLSNSYNMVIHMYVEIMNELE